MINLFGLFEGVYCFVVRSIVNVFFFGWCFFFNCNVLFDGIVY